jgi:neutral ceramidase
MDTRMIRVAAGVTLLVAAPLMAQKAGPLRAGAAQVDITPPPEAFPINVRSQILGGVHDPLFVHALVLDNGSSKVALISVDTTDMKGTAAVAVKAVAEELKVPASHLSISATHDHNTPTTGSGPGASTPAYMAQLVKGIVEAARQANAKLQPARIGFGTGLAYVNTNRDEKIGTAYHMGYAPERPTDRTVAVMLVTNSAGEPIAVWSNYGVHGVVMYLSKTKNGMAEITGDIGGAVAHYVEDRMKNVVMVWTMGAAGDQNPLFMSTYNQDAPDVHDEGEAGWAILDVQARRVGEEILRVANSIQNTTDKAVLWGAEATVTCPGRKRDPASVPPAPASGTTGSTTSSLIPATPIKFVDGDPVAIPLGLIMINDIALTNVSGEVFTEIAQKMKKESIFDRTAMITMSNGRVNYIPSESAYLLPSQMAANNPIKPGCAEHEIVDTFIGLEKQYLPVWTAAH